MDDKFLVCFSVLGRCRLGLFHLWLETEGDAPVVRRHRYERCGLLCSRPAHVADLHRAHGWSLVAGSAGVLTGRFGRLHESMGDSG